MRAERAGHGGLRCKGKRTDTHLKHRLAQAAGMQAVAGRGRARLRNCPLSEPERPVWQGGTGRKANLHGAACRWNGIL